MILVTLSVVLMLIAGVAAVALSARRALAERVFRTCLVAGAIAGLVPALRVLGGGTVADVSVASHVPGGPWVFGLDSVSAVFLLAVLLAGSASAFYGVTYLRRDASRRGVAVPHLLMTMLLAAMTLVVVARAAVPFLIAWEAMALTSYALIVTDHDRAENRRAGMLYLVATHAGTLALFALFAVWGSGGGDLSFGSLAAHPPVGPAQAAVLVAALVGFGMKAGVVPMHFWLPEAHAAAPSHVSAVMSGVVIKMGIYGLMRVGMLLGVLPAWWGWLLLALGAASGVLGVLWALAQHDLKRLLAFHSVENIGIILLGLGAGSLGVTYDHPLVAVLGFAGAALHTLNHALFKSLLFLAAGSVAHATGTREIDRLGGLARRMPRTAIAFLIGSAAIVGLPPLNGFLSEWLVFRSLLQAGLTPESLRMAVLAVAALGLIGALALACFAKVMGVVFLGSPRDAGVAAAHESTPGMMQPMAFLAAACAAIGLLPALVLPPLFRVGALVAGASLPGVWTLGVDPAVRTITWFTVALAAALAAAWAARSRLQRRRASRAADTWGCGFSPVTPRMQYTASSFATPVLDAYRAVAGVRVHRTATSFATHAVDPVLDAVVLPVWHGVQSAAGRVRPLQRGRLSLYLIYIVAALVGVLLYLVRWGRAS